MKVASPIVPVESTPVIVSGSFTPAGSVSFVSTRIVTPSPSSLTSSESATAVGLTFRMSIVALSVSLKPPPSVTIKSTTTELGPSNPSAEKTGVIPTSSPRPAAAPVSPKTASPSKSHKNVNDDVV